MAGAMPIIWKGLVIKPLNFPAELRIGKHSERAWLSWESWSMYYLVCDPDGWASLLKFMGDKPNKKQK